MEIANSMIENISKYLRLVKFSHTIFAMPFALMAFTYALWSTEAEFSLWLLVQVVLCMVFARNVAMGFNRWADRDIDAENPRTADREIPSGAISPRKALAFVIINATASDLPRWRTSYSVFRSVLPLREPILPLRER